MIVGLIYYMVIGVACSNCIRNLQARVIQSNGTSAGICPPVETRAEVRRQIIEEVYLLLLPGLTEINPVTSCNALPVSSPSGDYWIQPAGSSSAVQVYCDFNSQCGGVGAWTRVALINMSDPNQHCPGNFSTLSSPIRACGLGKGDINDFCCVSDCASAIFSTFGMSYSRVCGRILAYQDGASDGFDDAILLIDDSYLDGISVTYSSEPRQHVWSFVDAIGEGNSPSFQSNWLCDCSNRNDWPFSTYFIGNDYFCDTGNNETTWSYALSYLDDLLWDGAGCGSTSTCCDFNNPPWFNKTLPQPTVEDLEVRSCHTLYDGYDSLIQVIELYVQ